MENPTNNFELLLERAEEYGKTTLELSRLKALELSIAVVTSLISRLSVVVVFSLFTLVFNLGVAVWLGEILGKPYYGYFIVALFYLLVGILLHSHIYNWIKKPVSELIIAQTLK